MFRRAQEWVQQWKEAQTLHYNAEAHQFWETLPQKIQRNAQNGQETWTEYVHPEIYERIRPRLLEEGFQVQWKTFPVSTVYIHWDRPAHPVCRQMNRLLQHWPPGRNRNRMYRWFCDG